ncbi:unnamed protein product [Strongylus vulgaris]|uniref:Uncharacterized protein n=1 Tax=Strongylus vulgaris TaxID=40348 RepID=A0A3P7IHG2_STRVU|nr:unnamed protein product [Strongylus vulgaris]
MYAYLRNLAHGIIKISGFNHLLCSYFKCRHFDALGVEETSHEAVVFAPGGVTVIVKSVGILWSPGGDVTTC